MNTRFLDACWGKPVDRTPVWLMRQAGRYLPDYMRVRSKCTFLELCKTPELAAEVTIQPVDILGVDAAILFSDILTPVEPMGMKLDFVPGPVFEHPIRTMADVEALRIPDPEAGCPLCARNDQDPAPRTGQQGAAHRLRRRTVHPCLLHGRRERVQGLGQHQADDVHRPRCLCSAHGKGHHDGHGVSERPDQGRRPGDPDLRHLGRRPLSGRL